MTPTELIRELALIAVVMVGWVALVMLMLERDRKRRARYAGMTDAHQGAESSEARPSSSTATEEPRATAAQENQDAR